MIETNFDLKADNKSVKRTKTHFINYLQFSEGQKNRARCQKRLLMCLLYTVFYDSLGMILKGADCPL